VLRIQHCPLDSHSPCVSHFVEDDPEVSAFVGVEGPWDVLPYCQSWKRSICCIAHLPDNPHRLVKQAGPRTSETSPLPGDGKILTRRPEIDRIDRFKNPSVDVLYVVELRDVGPVFSENPLALLVPFGLPSATPAGGFESEIEATDASEETAESEGQKGSSPSNASCDPPPTRAACLVCGFERDCSLPLPSPCWRPSRVIGPRRAGKTGVRRQGRHG